MKGMNLNMNNTYVSNIIFGKTFERAVKILDNIMKLINPDDIQWIRKNSYEYIIELKDGTYYRALKLTTGCRGYRCNKAIVDYKIDNEAINLIIKPYLVTSIDGKEPILEVSIFSKIMELSYPYLNINLD